MSITTVAELRTALGIGTLYTDAVLQSVCDASDDVLLPFLWTNVLPATGHSKSMQSMEKALTLQQLMRLMSLRLFTLFTLMVRLRQLLTQIIQASQPYRKPAL